MNEYSEQDESLEKCENGTENNGPQIFDNIKEQLSQEDVKDFKSNGMLTIVFESTKYHILLILSLGAFILFYSMPWIRMDNLTALIASLGINIFTEATGLNLIVSAILSLPMLFSVLSIICIFTNKKVKLLAFFTGVISLLYWGILYLTYSIGKIWPESVIQYSFSPTFFIVLIFAFSIIILSIISPRKIEKTSKGYFLFRKELEINYYNTGIKLANVILIMLVLFTPLVNYNSLLKKFVGRPDLLEQFLKDNFNSEFNITFFIKFLSIIIVISNIILKIPPVIFTLIYLVKNWKRKENLRLNRFATIYIMVVFGLLWYFLKGLDKVLVLTPFIYVEVLICTGLIVVDTLVWGSLKGFTQKSMRNINKLRDRFRPF